MFGGGTGGRCAGGGCLDASHMTMMRKMSSMDVRRWHGRAMRGRAMLRSFSHDDDEEDEQHNVLELRHRDDDGHDDGAQLCRPDGTRTLWSSAARRREGGGSKLTGARSGGRIGTYASPP